MFIGRETELKFLEHYYAEADSKIIVVYGQKGVGKTTLLKHFSGERKMSYYFARACSAREQRYQWAFELRKSGKTVNEHPEYKELFMNSISFNEEQKQLIIIDEFHNIVKSDSSFMAELIYFVKNLGRPVMVLLCSSAAGWVENSMIQKIGSYAAYLAGLLKVRDLKFRDICKIYPNYEQDQQLQMYAALGGVPGAWNHFTEGLSAKENICKHMLNTESRLYEDMSVMISEELREPAVYNTLLSTMARGCYKLNDLYEHTGFSRAKISVYLKALMELDIVEKIYSYETAGYANSQKGIYRISNSLVRFYYRFIFPNLSMLQLMSTEEFYNQYVGPYFADYASEAYRNICSDDLSAQFNILGEWFGKSGKIDILMQNAEKQLIAVLCSYAKGITFADYKELLHQTKKARVKPDMVYLFSETGFTDDLITYMKKGKVKLFHLTEKEK